MSFEPRYSITSRIASALMRIEAARQVAATLPLNERVLAGLRQSAPACVDALLDADRGQSAHAGPGGAGLVHGRRIHQRERDEKEVKGYYAALDHAESYAAGHKTITETYIRKLHALAMAGGKTRCKPTPYRNGQNVIRDSGSGAIVYMPPEAADVPILMKEMVVWINLRTADVPVPIVAAIAHYQFATIHPYYDGNGRVAPCWPTRSCIRMALVLGASATSKSTTPGICETTTPRSMWAKATTITWVGQRPTLPAGSSTSSSVWPRRSRPCERRCSNPFRRATSRIRFGHWMPANAECCPCSTSGLKSPRLRSPSF